MKSNELVLISVLKSTVYGLTVSAAMGWMPARASRARMISLACFIGCNCYYKVMNTDYLMTTLRELSP